MGKKRREIPRLPGGLIETHCHLDYLEQLPLPEILARAGEVGVERIVTIAVEPDNFAAVQELARSHRQVSGTQGVHPHHAGQWGAAAREAMVQGLAGEGMVAVGEIGLDYYYDNAPREAQRRAFAEQLAIAAELDLPVVIHTREAEDDTRAILAEHAPALARRGVIHSFTSSPALAEACLELGFMLGFNGIVTFRTADQVREVLALTPGDRIVIETDAPFLTPVPYRGRENAPFYLPFVAEKVAAVKECEPGELMGRLRANALALFWPRELAGTGQRPDPAGMCL